MPVWRTIGGAIEPQAEQLIVLTIVRDAHADGHRARGTGFSTFGPDRSQR